MNGEFQDRKDIDKLFHDLYRIDGKTANVVKYNEDTKFVDSAGNLQTIDEILSIYYDSGEVDEKILDAITGEGIDLSDYVKKSELTEDYDVDLDFQFGLSGQDDTIRINTAIVEKLLSVKQININGD